LNPESALSKWQQNLALRDENMILLKQLGVNHISAFMVNETTESKGNYYLSRLTESAYFEIDDLVDIKKSVESHGLDLSEISLMLFPRW
jgi:arabinogalactan endo-1,4-beta-galactosidase